MTQHLASFVIVIDMFQAFVTVEEKENRVLRISPAQHSTASDDCRQRKQGRRSIFPDRLSTTRLRLPRQPAAANGATTPGFLVPFPSECVDAAHAGSRALLSVSWQLPRSLSLRDASPGSESSPLGRFSGRRPRARVGHCTGQVTTVPQSPKGGSQRTCPTLLGS